jgi:peroxiredoxin
MSGRTSEWVAAAVGLLVIAVTVFVAVRDIDEAADAWSQMGPLAPGDEIPRFRASLTDGEVLDNAALEGRVTLLNFWATWCGVCEQQMPNISSLHERFGGRGVRVIGVNQDRTADQAGVVDEYVAQRDLRFEFALDTGRMGQAFRVSLIPHVAIVDREGRLRYVHQGRVGEDTLAEELETLLSE